MPPLDGRVALVTGAGRRCAIGAAIARKLAADGARVVVHAWSPADAEQPWGADPDGPRRLVGELPHAVLVEADFADPEAPAAVVRGALDAFGRLDVLVANHARSSSAGLEDLTAAELDRTWAVNVRATLLLVREFAAHHDGAAGGRVVLFTSGQYHGAMPDELPYIASKGALHQLTGSLAVHLAGRGVTVNTVDPGPTDTGYADPPARAAVAALHPRGRWGTPEDTARLVAWLAGPEAGWVTGQVIASDGGWAVRPRG
jgi:3-oxoacyl-[acyl-carrier protein] reductase